MILATVENFQLPAIQGIPGPKRRYRLTDDYRFEYEEKGRRYARTVFMMDQGTDEETETDLASSPDEGPLGALAGSIGIDNAGPSDGGAALHDNGYERLGKFLPGEFQVLNPATGEWEDCTEPVTRLRCDLLYFKMCRLGGMPLHKAVIEFSALRVGAISRRNGVRWYFS